MSVVRRRNPELDAWLSNATVDELRRRIDNERDQRIASKMVIDECEAELAARQKTEWDHANGRGVNT